METRGDLRPDPEHDPIQALFYSIHNDVPPDTGTRQETGVFIVHAESAALQQAASHKTGPRSVSPNIAGPKIAGPMPGTSGGSDGSKNGEPVKQCESMLLQKSGVDGLQVTYVQNEIELLKSFVDLVLK